MTQIIKKQKQAMQNAVAIINQIETVEELVMPADAFIGKFMLEHLQKQYAEQVALLILLLPNVESWY